MTAVRPVGEEDPFVRSNIGNLISWRLKNGSKRLGQFQLSDEHVVPPIYREVSSAADELKITDGERNGISGTGISSLMVPIGAAHRSILVAKGVTIDAKAMYGMKALQSLLQDIAKKLGLPSTSFTREGTVFALKIIRWLSLPVCGCPHAVTVGAGGRSQAALDVCRLAASLSNAELFSFDGCASKVLCNSMRSTPLLQLRALLCKCVTIAVRESKPVVFTIFSLGGIPSNIVLQLLRYPEQIVATEDLWALASGLSHNKNDGANKTASEEVDYSIRCSRIGVDAVRLKVANILRRNMRILLFAGSEEDLTGDIISSLIAAGGEVIRSPQISATSLQDISLQCFGSHPQKPLFAQFPSGLTGELNNDAHLLGLFRPCRLHGTDIGHAGIRTDLEGVDGHSADLEEKVSVLFSAWSKVVAQAAPAVIKALCPHFALTPTAQKGDFTSLVVEALTMARHLMLLGATTLTARTLLLNAALLRISDWSLQGEKLLRKNRGLSKTRRSEEESLAVLSQRQTEVESEISQLGRGLAEFRSALHTADAHVKKIVAEMLQIVHEEERAREVAKSKLSAATDEDYQDLCSMAFGEGQGSEGQAAGVDVTGDDTIFTVIESVAILAGNLRDYSGTSGNSNMHVQLLITFLLDPALEAKLEMFNVESSEAASGIITVTGKFEELWHKLPSDTQERCRRDQEERQLVSPAIMYACCLKSSGLEKSSTALDILCQWLTATVVLRETMRIFQERKAELEINKEETVQSAAEGILRFSQMHATLPYPGEPLNPFITRHVIFQRHGCSAGADRCKAAR
jgi:hypothetical protein